MKISAPKGMFWEIPHVFVACKNYNMSIGVNPLHYHEKVEIYYMHEGDCEWFVDQRPYHFKSGDIALIPSGVTHRRSRESKIPITRTVVYCNNSMFPENIQRIMEEGAYFIGSLPKSASIVTELLVKIQQEHENRDSFSETLIKSYLAELASLIYRTRQNHEEILAKSENGYISKAIAYIKDTYQSRITLESASKHAGVSAAHLSRSFKEDTGFNFNEYLNLYRLKQAEEALKSEDKSILEIAYDCGFNDSGYFTACFKKTYGVTPTQYKKAFSKK